MKKMVNKFYLRKKCVFLIFEILIISYFYEVIFHFMFCILFYFYDTYQKIFSVTKVKSFI